MDYRDYQLDEYDRECVEAQKHDALIDYFQSRYDFCGDYLQKLGIAEEHIDCLSDDIMQPLGIPSDFDTLDFSELNMVNRPTDNDIKEQADYVLTTANLDE